MPNRDTTFEDAGDQG
jgi:hypothetical protein